MIQSVQIESRHCDVGLRVTIIVMINSLVCKMSKLCRKCSSASQMFPKDSSSPVRNEPENVLLFTKMNICCFVQDSPVLCWVQFTVKEPLEPPGSYWSHCKHSCQLWFFSLSVFVPFWPVPENVRCKLESLNWNRSEFEIDFYLSVFSQLMFCFFSIKMFSTNFQSVTLNI